MMDDLSRRARRATTGRTVLDSLAVVFLGCSFAFWGVLHYQAFVTSPRDIPQIVVAIAMTLIYTFALPLLLSMLVPTTPAGQLLQKTQWRTIGFPFIIASAVLLGYHAFNLMLLWFGAQPGIAEAGQTRAYALSAVIGFVVIPALCWVQVTPERWLREIEQAHMVKRLEMQQRGDLAILKAKLLWAEQKALVGFANLLPAEQQEVVAVMRGLMMGISDTQRSIARTLGVQGEIERSIMGDAEIAEHLDYVAQQLEKPAASMDKALTWIDDSNRESHVDIYDSAAPAHVNTRSQSSISREPRDDTRRHMTPGDDAYARAAADHFGRKPWTLKQLCAELEIGETKAREMRDDWLHRGLIDQTNLGRWHFTEGEG